MNEIKVPVLIVNYRPFRLLCRDKSDTWGPTLEQINNNGYDYVKLHRASRFFNAHLPGSLPACLGFDGSIIFPYIKEFESDYYAAEEANRILASVFLGGVYVESVAPFDVSKGTMNGTGYYRHSSSQGSNADFHRAIGECDAGVLASIKLLEPEVLMADEVISAYTYGYKILSKLPSLSPSLFIGSFTYYRQHRLRESLAHAWISIEQILEFVWHKTIVENAKSVNIQNRRKFIESQQWNSAHKIEVLFQNGYFSADDYSLLSRARLARNDFIHKGIPPTYEETHAALISLVLLIEVASKINEVDFHRGNLIKNLAGSMKHQSNEEAQTEKMSVKYWRAMKIIPGDKGWKGDYETFPDITLSEISMD